jgi:hypothetical protein
MDELQEFLDSLGLVNCDAGDIAGFGFAGCKKDKNRIVTIELTKAGFNYEGKSKTYIQAQQKLGNIIILQDVVSFETADSTPNYDTRPGSNLDRLAGETPGKTVVMFDNGMDFGNSLRDLISYGQYNLAAYDVSGAKYVIKTKSGKVKGISIAQIYVMPYKGSDGTVAPSTKMEFQYTDVSEETRQVRIDADSLDFSPSELTDVNDITLNIEPITAGTSIVFNPLLGDRTHQVPGITIANLKVSKTTAGNTTTITPTVIVYGPDSVTLTVPTLASGDIVTIQTNDVVSLKNIILIEEILYKSKKETAIVA